MDNIKDVFNAKSHDGLLGFLEDPQRMSILKRQKPEGADAFFSLFFASEFKTLTKVQMNDPELHIRQTLEQTIPDKIRAQPFYETWVADIRKNCEAYANLLGEDSLFLKFRTARGNTLLHKDAAIVNARLLCAHKGAGPCWAPFDAINKEEWAKYSNLRSTNEKLLPNQEDEQSLDTWDVGVIRGGENGIVHRSPHVPERAENGSIASLLMVLDRPNGLDTRFIDTHINKPQPEDWDDRKISKALELMR